MGRPPGKGKRTTMSVKDILSKGWWKYGAIAAVLLGATIVGLALSRAPYSPDQPIAFNHKSHAGDNQIPCLYCHTYARSSALAGVPTVEKCVGCHKVTARDKDEVKKLLDYYERKQPIAWARIYKVPDFVYFSHQWHVKKDIKCQQCHGPVETMERVRKVSSLSMGWCLECHKAKEASLDCLVCHK